MFWWTKLQVWSIEEFFFIAGYCIVLFMLASMLYPPEFSHDLDCEEYFFANRSWFFGIQLAAWLLDIPETLAKASAHLRDVPRQYEFFLPAMLLICLIGLGSANRRVHGVLCLAWFAATVGYLTFTSLDKIAAQ